MIKAEFAPGYNKEPETGWFRFPADAEYRKALFPHLVLADHPAKANVYMTQALIEYVSEPGEMILEPFGGTGTTMVAALIGRRVTIIELEKGYQEIIQQGMKSLDSFAPGAAAQISLLPGDVKRILPIVNFADHIVTSPPYGNILRKKTMDKFTADTMTEGILTYSESPENIGNLNDFMYRQVMEKVYKKFYDTLKPGGTLSIIIKDHIEKGKRVEFGQEAHDDCKLAGFKLINWFKWRPQGTAYTSIHKAQGLTVVEEEDLIIMQKPGG